MQAASAGAPAPLNPKRSLEIDGNGMETVKLFKSEILDHLVMHCIFLRYAKAKTPTALNGPVSRRLRLVTTSRYQPPSGTEQQPSRAHLVLVDKTTTACP